MSVQLLPPLFFLSSEIQREHDKLLPSSLSPLLLRRFSKKPPPPFFREVIVIGLHITLLSFFFPEFQSFFFFFFLLHESVVGITRGFSPLPFFSSPLRKEKHSLPFSFSPFILSLLLSFFLLSDVAGAPLFFFSFSPSCSKRKKALALYFLGMSFLISCETRPSLPFPVAMRPYPSFSLLFSRLLFSPWFGKRPRSLFLCDKVLGILADFLSLSSFHVFPPSPRKSTEQSPSSQEYMPAGSSFSFSRTDSFFSCRGVFLGKEILSLLFPLDFFPFRGHPFFRRMRTLLFLPSPSARFSFKAVKTFPPSSNDRGWAPPFFIFSRCFSPSYSSDGKKTGRSGAPFPFFSFLFGAGGMTGNPPLPRNPPLPLSPCPAPDCTSRAQFFSSF